MLERVSEWENVNTKLHIAKVDARGKNKTSDDEWMEINLEWKKRKKSNKN